MSKPISNPITVLIVEDEALIRMDVADYFTDEKFLTVEATTAHDAISILEGRKDIDVVFTDVNMPGSIDGMELAYIVRERWPTVSLAVTSGMVRPSQSSLPDRVRFFAKPYDLSELSGWIRSNTRSEK